MSVSDARKQLSEITNSTIQQAEVIEVLRRMDSDGVIQLNERAQTFFVRTGVSA